MGSKWLLNLACKQSPVLNFRCFCLEDIYKKSFAEKKENNKKKIRLYLCTKNVKIIANNSIKKKKIMLINVDKM